MKELQTAPRPMEKIEPRFVITSKRISSVMAYPQKLKGGGKDTPAIHLPFWLATVDQFDDLPNAPNAQQSGTDSKAKGTDHRHIRS